MNEPTSIDTLLAGQQQPHSEVQGEETKNPLYMTLDTATDSLYSLMGQYANGEELDQEGGLYVNIATQLLGYAALANYISENPKYQDNPETPQVMSYLQGAMQAYASVLGAYAQQMQKGAYKEKTEYK